MLAPRKCTLARMRGADYAPRHVHKRERGTRAHVSANTDHSHARVRGKVERQVT